jgi:hypothetical protein
VSRRRIGFTIATVMAVVIASVTLLPSSQRLTSAPLCLICGTLGGVDVLLNILLFAPLGLGLAMAGVPPARAIIGMCLYTLSIETAQTLIPGRDASLSDLITNSAGGACGFFLGTRINGLVRPTRRAGLYMGAAWLGLWLPFQFLSGWLTISAATEVRYHGQIKRTLGSRRAFSGDVLSASVAGISIPDSSLGHAPAVASALNAEDGAQVAVTVVPRGRQSRLRSIARIVDEDLEEIMLVARYESDLIFGVRTHGAALRLRPLYFALRGAFPDAADGDTVHLHARYARDALTLRMTTGGVARETRIRLAPAHSWRMFMPAQLYADGSRSDRVFDAAWVALLLMPAAYWFATARGDRRLRAYALSIAAAGVGAGVIGVPALLGLSPPGVAELAGVTAATLLGAAMARGAKPAELLQ